MHPTNEEPSYVAAWRQYRLRRALFVAAWIGFIASFTSGHLGRLLIDNGIVAVLILWGAWLPLRLWRCPRCHRRFFSTWGFMNCWARWCMHCGLPKWSLSSDSHDLRLPRREPDLEAEVRFLSPAAGGRATSVVSGYRARLHHDDRDWDAVYEFPERDLVHPGDSAIARVWLMSPDEQRRPARYERFELREGQRVVARGAVTKVLAI